MGDVAELVTGIIKKGKVVVFSKTTCPYCDQAKGIFNKVGHDFVTVELNEEENGQQMQDYLGQLTGARTVPRVFIKGKCYGGASDLKKLHETGELKTILA